MSDQVFAILERFSPLVEPLSIDEAFLDVTGCERLLGPAERIAAEIMHQIRHETQLTASLGVAPNKFLAKLASDLKKPDGLVIITEENAQQALDPLPVSRIWGVGPAGAKALEALGVRTIGQLRKLPEKTLQDRFGEWGLHCHRLARGVDNRPVEPDSQAKSIGQEETFPEDVAELEYLRDVLLGQVQEVARRLRKHGLKARTVTLKIRCGDFTTLTRSRTLPEATNTTETLWQTSESILRAWSQKAHRPLRLLGMTASGLQGRSGSQLPLFSEDRRLKQDRLDRAVDTIAARFGPGAVARGLGARQKRRNPDRNDE
jgi:DNA polymerase-4